MQELELWVAIVIGVIQGVFEWLPISSEGNVSLFLTLFTSTSPEAAVQLSLFLHAGTAVSATLYYKNRLLAYADGLSAWRPGFGSEFDADVSFLVGATTLSVVVAAGAYAALTSLVTEVAGGVFVALIGFLLVVTGLVQRAAEQIDIDKKRRPDILDVVLVGVFQGIAVLPGVSRSGTTVSALLIRGHDANTSLRLSFMLSIPASLGAGLLASQTTSHLPLTAGATALFTSAVIGYITIDALTRIAERIAFWVVCVLLGTVAVIGGSLIFLLP